MTTANHRASPGDMWRIFFNEQHSNLITVAKVLAHSGISPQHVLDQAMMALAGSPVREAFQSTAAFRAVVKAALLQHRGVAASPNEAELQASAKDGGSGHSPIEKLPWPERAVYFLRRVLCYSRRDTALLLGMSDANVDQIQQLAEKRIGQSNSLSGVDIFQQQFQWLLKAEQGEQSGYLRAAGTGGTGIHVAKRYAQGAYLLLKCLLCFLIIAPPGLAQVSGLFGIVEAHSCMALPFHASLKLSDVSATLSAMTDSNHWCWAVAVEFSSAISPVLSMDVTPSGQPRQVP